MFLDSQCRVLRVDRQVGLHEPVLTIAGISRARSTVNITAVFRQLLLAALCRRVAKWRGNIILPWLFKGSKKPLDAGNGGVMTCKQLFYRHAWVLGHD